MTLILVCNHTCPSYVPVMTRDCQVTGASGFIGSHVVDQLLKSGYSVRGYVYILGLNTTQRTYGVMILLVRCEARTSRASERDMKASARGSPPPSSMT